MKCSLFFNTCYFLPWFTLQFIYLNKWGEGKKWIEYDYLVHDNKREVNG